MAVEMSHRCRALWALAALWMGLGAGSAQGTTPEPDAQETRALHGLFERHWEDSARLFPEWATYRGDHRFGDRLADVSLQARQAQDAQTRAWLDAARKIRRERLSATDRVSLDMFIDSMEESVAMQAFVGYRNMTLRALGGPQSQVINLLQVVPMGRREQAEQLLARMAAYPRRMEQEIAALKHAKDAGWVPARDVLQRVLAQIDAQLAPTVDEGPYWGPFKRLGSAIPEAERQALQAAGREAITRHVVPQVRQLRAFVADELMPVAHANGAMKNYPEGVQVYEMLVRRRTTTSLTPREIHDIGLRELARLRGEMEAVMRDTKFEGSFAQFVQYLNTDPRFFHKSPEALLAGYREIAKRIDAEMPRLFAELPRVPYGIQAMPAMWGNRAEFYNGPPLDGSRSGTFFANTYSWRTRPIWGMETLVAHEAAPGHHTQIARNTELAGLPPFRRSGFGYTAYSEGWGLYAETLGFELGLYTDPYSRFGHLQWQAFRAARLVVDTGLHAFGWTSPQAIDYMVERTGVDRAFVASEIDRYLSEPAQALAYMIGQLKIIELRDRAKAKLGARFDIRRFHNAVLDQGAMPLGTLERLIDEWIAAQLGKEM